MPPNLQQARKEMNVDMQCGQVAELANVDMTLLETCLEV